MSLAKELLEKGENEVVLEFFTPVEKFWKSGQLQLAELRKQTAADALRTRMRGLISELATLLPDNDARWYAFGLSAPGDPETPGTPAAATLTPGIAGSGLLFLDWPDTRRTERYRVWQKKPGETAFTPVATITESDANLTALPIANFCNSKSPSSTTPENLLPAPRADFR